MLSCYKATVLISLSHERPLAFPEKLALNSHLLLCSLCRNFRDNSRTLSKAMAEFTKQP